MLTLLSEFHFWSLRCDLRIKSSDLGAFRLLRNRELQQQEQQEAIGVAKRDYTEKRNGVAVLKNKHGTRLKDNMKKLEELLKLHRIVTSQWQDANQLLLLFTNGLIAHICVNVTGDILHMVFEKYLVGKLAAELICDAFFTRSHIVLSYNTNQLTVVHLQRPNNRVQAPTKITSMDPRIFHVIIPGPTAERKLARHLAVNSSFDLFVIWTQSSQNEVYPWRPTIRDQDRANIHIFKLKGMQLELNCYCWSEHDPLCVDFLRSSESQLLTVEQKVSRKGEMSAEICSYEIVSGKMQRSSLSSITLGTQICCCAFSPDQEKLFLGTIDRTICMHDLVQQTTKFVKQIDIVPTLASWHSDSSIIMIANERSQFQCFDLALTPIAHQLQSEDVTPSILLDLSHYFSVQPPTLQKICFNRKPDLANINQNYAPTDCFLFVQYEHGPIGCLRYFSAAGMRGDIHNSGLTADVLISKYLGLFQLDKAVNLLMALNWETYGAMCLISLHQIANHVFYKGDTRRMRIELMAKALKTFAEELSEETKDEFSDQVFDLKRRYFFFLLRKNLYAEAYEIAQDIEDYDLFMDLFNVTKSDESIFEFSSLCFSQAAAILHEENRAQGNLSLMGDYPESQYLSSNSDIGQRHQQTPVQPQQSLKNYVPPLPSLKSKVFNAEMIKINIPKPELRLESSVLERTRPPPPPLPDIKHLKKSNPASSNVGVVKIKVQPPPSPAKPAEWARNGNETSISSWHSTPDQTLGIPHPYTPSTAHNILPRATTTHSSSSTSLAFNLSQINNNYSNVPTTSLLQSSYNSASAFVQYAATPVTVDSNDISTMSANKSATLPPVVSTLTPAPPLYQPKYYQHPLVSGNIPSTATPPFDINYQRRLLMKKPTASILSNGSTSQQNGNILGNAAAITNINIVNGGKEVTRNGSGEQKNKVKFSDTVQVAVVCLPEIPRKEKPAPGKRNGYSRPPRTNLTNPKKELADSLPLCHPNDDYLKDFNPITAETMAPVRTTTTIATKTSTKEETSTTITTNKPPPPAPPSNSNNSSSTSIKVVHFGVV